MYAIVDPDARANLTSGVVIGETGVHYADVNRLACNVHLKGPCHGKIGESDAYEIDPQLLCWSLADLHPFHSASTVLVIARTVEECPR